MSRAEQVMRDTLAAHPGVVLRDIRSTSHRRAVVVARHACVRAVRAALPELQLCDVARHVGLSIFTVRAALDRRAQPVRSAPATGPLPERRIVATRRFCLEEIDRQIARHAPGMARAEVLGRSREGLAVFVRREALRACHAAHPEWSIADLARVFNRSHATVLHHLGRRGRRG